MYIFACVCVCVCVCLPSEDIEAPESLNSSLPIWMGKTRSRGRISGIVEMFFSVWTGGPTMLPAGVESITWPLASSGLPCSMAESDAIRAAW